MPIRYIARILGCVVLLTATALFLISATVRAQTDSVPNLELGASLYAQNCAVCHGQSGQGRIGATLNKDWPSIDPRADIGTTIRRGVSGSPMPAWSRAYGGPLTEVEIDSIVAYILRWQSGAFEEFTPIQTATSRPPITPVPEVKGDPNRGAILFDENCAVCHGPNGEGRIGATLAKDWPSVRPDLTIRATIARGAGDQMPAWSQEFGGPLSDDQIDDIVAFIQTLPEQEGVSVPTPEVLGGETSIFSGWFGVVIGILIFGILIGIAIWSQRERNNKNPA